MAKRPPLGRQPFHAILAEEGRTLAGTARVLGYDVGHLMRVSYGRRAPSPELRRALAKLLRRPVSELFTPQALKYDYSSTAINARGFRRGDAS